MITQDLKKNKKKIKMSTNSCILYHKWKFNTFLLIDNKIIYLSMNLFIYFFIIWTNGIEYEIKILLYSNYIMMIRWMPYNNQYSQI